MATDPQANDLFDSFSTLIRQGCLLFDDLQKTLEQEQLVLQQRDLEALKLNTQTKHELLLNIEVNIRERNSVLVQAGFAPSESGFDEFTQMMPETKREALLTDWHQLQNLLMDVRTASKRNEQILVRSKQNVDQLLSLLQGHQSSNVLYDTDGSKGNYTAQRRIGKA